MLWYASYNVSDRIMKKILDIIGQLLNRIRRTYWGELARIYSLCIKRSQPVKVGLFTIGIETYCESIQNKCKNLNIIIPAPGMREPNKLEQLFMSVCFRWPVWPVRVMLYKGQLLEQIETSPYGISKILEMIYNTSVSVTDKNNRKASERIPKPRISIPSNRHRDSQSRSRTDSVHQEKPVFSSREPMKERPQDAYKKVEGAIFDNSF